MTQTRTKTVRFHATGDASVLKFVEEDLPIPAQDEVRIRVHAIGLNRAEIMMRTGTYLEQPEFPSKLGYEAAGYIDAVGAGVDQWEVGDRVSTVPAFSMTRHGVYGEYTIVPASAVASAPNALSLQEASAVWMAMITAYGALVDICELNASQTVLITAASSSVGVAAIQLAKSIGATTIAVTRGSEKVDALMAIGADEVIQTNTEDLESRVQTITRSTGVDAIFDPIGGPLLDTLALVAAPGATIVEYGALDDRPTPYPLFPALQKGLTIKGYTLFEVTQSPERLQKAMDYIVPALASGAMKPVIDRVFEFEQIQAAHAYMEAGQQFGKIVVNVRSES